MIIKQDNTVETQVIGDIENNKVSIDKENIDFIATLLTSNLYSNPFESFLRETISNAYDAQVEAGTLDKNIILLIDDHGDDDKELRISVRDFGTGISPERFNTIYNKIGSSTKRQSNDYIGGLGIGKFAGLSISDIVEINSFYNGTVYNYLMYKQGAGIQIDKISESPTEYENGVEVSVVVPFWKYDYSAQREYEKAIKNMCFFENLKLVKRTRNWSTLSENNFNNRTIVEYKHYSSCDLLPGKISLKVGKVVYPARTLSKVDTPVNFGIALNIPIGSVMVTPNREDLIYTRETENTISGLWEFALDDLIKDIARVWKSQFNNLAYFHIKLQNRELYYDILNQNHELNGRGIDRTFTDNIFKEMGLKEEVTRLLKNSYALSFYIRNPYINKFISDAGVWSTAKNDVPLRQLVIPTRNKVTQVFVVKEWRISSKIKAWINTHYNSNNSIIMTEADVKTVIKLFAYYSVKQLGYSAKLTKAYIKDMLTCIKYTVVNEEDIPQSFVWRTPKETKTVVNPNTVSVDLYRSFTYTNSATYERFSFAAIKRITEKSLIVYTIRKREIDPVFLDTMKTIQNNNKHEKHIKFCTIGAKDVKLIENNKRWISVEDFLSKPNKIIVKIVTANKLARENKSPGISPYYGYIDHSMARKFILRDSFLNAYDSKIPDSMYNYYIEKGWVNDSCIKEYTITPEEVEYLKVVDELSRKQQDIIKALAIKKLSKETLLKLPDWRLNKQKSINTLKSLI
jgi:hypothetical protein